MIQKKPSNGGKTSRSNSKQSLAGPPSVRKRFSSLCSPNNQVNCVFCQKFKNNKIQSYSLLLNKALFAKYSSSQNYYYSKDINDIIEEESTPAVVFYRDLECIIEEDEYLKRSYNKKETNPKIKALLEYYKYHKDIPRLFMHKVYITINKFHEKKRRIEYAQIKKQLNIPDDDPQPTKKKEKKKDKHSDEDVTVGQLKHLLKDLKLETYSFHNQKKHDISSSVQLKEVIQQIGSKYDYLSQISGLLSIDQSNSFLLQSNELSSITNNFKSNYIQDSRSKISKSSKQQQNMDSKTTQQISYQCSFEKLHFNKLNYAESSSQAENSNKNGGQSKRSNQDISPIKNIQNKVPHIEGFSNFIRQQSQQQLKFQDTQINQKQNPLRKVSANFVSNENQFKMPSRQNSQYKQADLQSYQVNFLRTRVASQLQQYQEDDSKSNLFASTHLGKQPLATERVQRSSVYNKNEKSGQKYNQQTFPQKLNQYAITTLKNLQVKNVDLKKKILQNNKGINNYQTNGQLIHNRTKSQDAIISYRQSPPKQQQKDPIRITSNICFQGSNKKGVYNINQNNIVNIYIDDLKNSSKMKQGGSQTTRIGSPLKHNVKGIFEMYNTQRSSQSPHQKRKI